MNIEEKVEKFHESWKKYNVLMVHFAMIEEPAKIAVWREEMARLDNEMQRNYTFVYLE